MNVESEGPDRDTARMRSEGKDELSSESKEMRPKIKGRLSGKDSIFWG